ncbi:MULTISPECIES: hypothetical protein [Chryseobacterium]|uniref:Molecular chaperone GroES n=1 Tax=Chryseobacterium geocarposphaerae TaxID=1416776 RepID=A0ABU1LHY5_9FLAO|nr:MULTISPECIES: hypothetical protein [Chryseobacterium]MDR6406331.1 hypothetical protein [Chryseobacterium geocarposphaerae]MDR6699648.1 hypothetical protein [Chryseobacterium ginsenosidimutans]
MKKIIFTVFVFLMHFFNAQNVYLTKVEKTKENTDKFLYKIESEIKEAEYLGEIEVQGFSKDDAEIFSLIYKKAKEIGANSFSLKPFENVDGTPQNFNPANYRLSLYYLPKDKLINQTGYLYLFASSEKDQKIALNKKDYTISPRSYLIIKTIPGEVYTISTKKLLGSTIKIQPKENSSNQYFQISATKVKSDDTGTGGLNLKSGDIIGLEKSYAEFLTAIYNKENQSN